VRGIDRATLVSLVGLAERLETGLIGLFLEDRELQEAALLPFVREVLIEGGSERSISSEELKRQSRRLANNVQSILSELTATRRVACRFDFAAIAGSRTMSALGFGVHHVYLPARTASALAPGHMVAFRRLRLLYQEGPDSARAIEIVHRLARNGQVREVFVVSDRELPASVLATLKSSGVRVHREMFHDTLADHLVNVLARPACDLLMIPRSVFKGTPDAAVEAALNRVSRPVLLVSS
jgi:hypothetical protein